MSQKFHWNVVADVENMLGAFIRADIGSLNACVRKRREHRSIRDAAAAVLIGCVYLEC
jgi:hypothetical protein